MFVCGISVYVVHAAVILGDSICLRSLAKGGQGYRAGHGVEGNGMIACLSAGTQSISPYCLL